MKIIIKNLQKKIPITLARVKRIASKTLLLGRVNRTGEITICFVNNKTIKKLNQKFLKANRATDVLAFDISVDKKEILADIAISTDAAIANAKIFKTSPLYELDLYIAHGLLHLLGYDDRTPRQKRIMDRKANHVLSTLTKDGDRQD